MSSKDDGLDDIDLGDDFDLGDLDMELTDGTGGTIIPNSGGSRTPISKSIEVGRSFKEELTGDKVQTLLDLSKAAIPRSLSKESDIVFNSYSSVSDEVRKQGNKLRLEAKRSMRTMKRFLPEDNSGFLNKVVNKSTELLGGDEVVSQTLAEPNQAERIASELSQLMGTKSDSDKLTESFKTQLDFKRQQETKELVAAESLNIERIRKFLFEVSDKYYRASLDVNLRQLFTMQALLEVTKSGFDLFTRSLNDIVKNTSLPDLVKLKNSELVRQQVSKRILSTTGSAMFKDGTPLSRITNKVTSKAKSYGESAVNTIQSVMGNVESAGTLTGAGLGSEQIIAMIAADLAKTQAGKFIGNKIEKTQTGNSAIFDAKNAIADPEDMLREVAKGKGPMAVLASTALLGMGGDKTRFSIESKDPNDVAFVDNRTKDSVNKVIPQLLAKIYGEVKTSRELQTIAVGGKRSLKQMGITSPDGNELAYDYNKGSFSTKTQMMRNIKSRTAKDASQGVGKLANELVYIFLEGAKEVFSSAETKLIRDAVIRVILEDGLKSVTLFKNKRFLELIGGPTSGLGKKVSTQYGIFKRRAKPGTTFQERANNIISYIRKSKGKHEGIGRELVDQGLTGEGVKLGILEQDPITGMVRGDRAGILEDIIQGATSSTVSAPEFNNEPTLKDQLKGKSLREKSALLIKATRDDVSKKMAASGDNEVGSFKQGGYTLDGAKGAVAGIVHRGEYVINKSKLKELISAVKDGDYGSVVKEVKSIAGAVAKQSKEYTASTNKLTTLFDNSKNVASTAVRKGSDFLDQQHGPMGSKLKSAKDLLVAGSKNAYGKADDYLNSSMDASDGNYILIWDKLTEDEQNAIRLEFFSSAEYSAKLITNFPLWLRDYKKINPGTLATRKGLAISSMLDIRNKVMTPINKFREELTQELTDKMSGKGVKELTLEQEEKLREAYFASKEYAAGYVQDFDIWLKTQGLARAGKTAIGKLKRMLNPRELLKKTRKLDRMLMGGLAKGVMKHGIRSPLYAAKGAYYGGKGLLGVANGPVRGIAGLVGDAVTDTASHIPGVRGLLKGRKTEAGSETGLFKLLGYFKAKDAKELAEKKRVAKKKAKEEKRSKFLSMFDKDVTDSKSNKPGFMAKIAKKSKSLITPLTVMLGIGALLQVTGTTMNDVKDGILGVIDGIKSVANFSKNTWYSIKETLAYTKQLPARLNYHIMSALSNLPFMKDLKPDPKRISGMDKELLDISRQGRDTSYDKNDVTTWTSKDIKTMSNTDKNLYESYQRGMKSSIDGKPTKEGYGKYYQKGSGGSGKAFTFDKASVAALYGRGKSKGVLPITAKLAEMALSLSKVYFSITSGFRTAGEQYVAYSSGNSSLDGMNKISDHQLGKAIDVYPRVSAGGKAVNMYNVKSEQVKAIWNEVYIAFVKAAKKLGLILEFGQTFNDWPHIGIKKIGTIDDTIDTRNPLTADRSEPGMSGVESEGSAATTAVEVLAGSAVAYGGYRIAKTAYNVTKSAIGAGKVVYKYGKKATTGTVNAAKSARDAIAKTKPVSTPKKDTMARKIKTFLVKLKRRVLAKVGPKAGAKLIAKIGSRFVPFVGWALLLVDAGRTVYFMTQGYSFESAVSKAVIGIDLFENDDEDVSNVTNISDSPGYKKPYDTTNNRPNLIDVNAAIRKTLSDETITVNQDGSVSQRSDTSNRDSSVRDAVVIRDRLLAKQQSTVKTSEPIQVTTNINLDDSEHLTTIAAMSTRAVDIQSQMLTALGDISGKLDRTLDTSNINKGGESLPPKPLPEPVINIKRKQAF